MSSRAWERFPLTARRSRLSIPSMQPAFQQITTGFSLPASAVRSREGGLLNFEDDISPPPEIRHATVPLPDVELYPDDSMVRELYSALVSHESRSPNTAPPSDEANARPGRESYLAGAANSLGLSDGAGRADHDEDLEHGHRHAIRSSLHSSSPARAHFSHSGYNHTAAALDADSSGPPACLYCESAPEMSDLTYASYPWLDVCHACGMSSSQAEAPRRGGVNGG